ncbi:glycosyltransferase family 2 protein [Pseudolactococcus yaeyamensis]
MRNHIIELNENDWLIFVDSDEYICDNGLSPENLASILALMSILSENDNVALQLKIKKPFQNGHTLAERGLKKASSAKYFNKIHEELQANDIKHFKIDFMVENQGTTPEEMEKFDKKSRYEKLVREILEESPQNIKMLLNYPFPEGDVKKSQAYLNLINQVILKNQALGWHQDNFLAIDDFPTLTQKYIMVLLSLGNTLEVIQKTTILLRTTPNDNFMLAMHYFAEWSLLQETFETKLSEFLQWYSEIDITTSLEESLMTKDFAVAIKYLFSLQKFDDATKLTNEVSDVTAKTLIKGELHILEKNY